MAARSLGKKDSVSEAAMAGLSLLKVWTKYSLQQRNSCPASVCKQNLRKIFGH
jgi:hypothetical protein